MGLRIPIPNTKPTKYAEVSTAPQDSPRAKSIITPFGDEMREGCMHLTAVFRFGERGIITDQPFSEELWIAAQSDSMIAIFIVKSIEAQRQAFIQQQCDKEVKP